MSSLQRDFHSHTNQADPLQTSIPQNTACQPPKSLFHYFPVTHSAFRAHTPTSHLQTAQLTETQGTSQILATRIDTRSSEPSLTPCRTSAQKGSLLPLLCHTTPPAVARKLTGLPQNMMIDDQVPTKCLSEPCVQDHLAYHRQPIQHFAAENFRTQQEPSLHLSVPRVPVHLLETFPLHTRLSYQSSRACVFHRGRSWRGRDIFHKAGLSLLSNMCAHHYSNRSSHAQPPISFSVLVPQLFHADRYQYRDFLQHHYLSKGEPLCRGHYSLH